MKITLNIDGPTRGITPAKSPKPWPKACEC